MGSRERHARGAYRDGALLRSMRSAARRHVVRPKRMLAADVRNQAAFDTFT